jgi:phage terminase large subunit-like protein
MVDLEELPPKMVLAMAIGEKARRKAHNLLAAYRPYPKQLEFHKAGADPAVRERLLKAGNQLGKTWSAGFETAMHLTGRYPDWWPGAVFDGHIAGWAAGVTSEVTRDSVQRVLCGRINALGTGAIPADAIKDKAMKRGVADAIDTLVIRHGGGGDIQAQESLLGFKSYDQGREKFQAETLDLVWLDEEPPLDIYTESLTRTNATDGIVYMTFTPLLGMSDVVKRFLVEKVPGTHVTTMTIYDAEHYTDEQRKAIINSYPAHEREARSMGVPTLGSGRIYPVSEEAIKIKPFSLPTHWPRICGLDFGWTHPGAAVWLTYDRDTDTVYVYDAHREKEKTPDQWSLLLRGKGAWIPVAWPHDGENTTQAAAGQSLAKQYRDAGVNMLKERATNPPDPAQGQKEGQGGNAVWPGVQDILDRMLAGRFKVFAHLHDWFEEMRMYHIDNGKIVKVDDDLMDATRTGVMMLRHAKTPPVNEHRAKLPAYTPSVQGLGPLG